MTADPVFVIPNETDRPCAGNVAQVMEDGVTCRYLHDTLRTFGAVKMHRQTNVCGNISAIPKHRAGLPAQSSIWPLLSPPCSRSRHGRLKASAMIQKIQTMFSLGFPSRIAGSGCPARTRRAPTSAFPTS